MDLYLGDVKITTLSVSKWSNGDMVQIVFPTEPGTYIYKVMFHDNEVCSVIKEIQ